LQQDYSQAVTWYRKATEKDDTQGMCNLGVMYENGSGGLPQDILQAEDLYRKAGTEGGACGMSNLGSLY
jgi:hypothetical protein